MGEGQPGIYEFQGVQLRLMVNQVPTQFFWSRSQQCTSVVTADSGYLSSKHWGGPEAALYVENLLELWQCYLELTVQARMNSLSFVGSGNFSFFHLRHAMYWAIVLFDSVLPYIFTWLNRNWFMFSQFCVYKSQKDFIFFLCKMKAWNQWS
jgi:hypothetical protein